MADVFGADVYQLEVGNSACLGAALRAFQADAVSEKRPVSWSEVVESVAEPMQSSRVRSDPARHAIYQQLMQLYAECEAHALGRGPEPRRPT
jgi:sugar (pentulose or hexulose) kinase